MFAYNFQYASERKKRQAGEKKLEMEFIMKPAIFSAISLLQ
jgi:hypothetical protein